MAAAFVGSNHEAIHDNTTRLAWIVVAIATVMGATQIVDTILKLGFEVVDTFVCVPRDHLESEPSYYIRVVHETARDSWVFHLATISCGGLVGVSRDFIAEYSRKTGMDTLDLDTIKNMSAAEMCAIIDMAGVRYPDIGPATHFLSHTWSQPIAEKIDAIKTQEHQANLCAATLATETNLLVFLLSFGLFGVKGAIKHGATSSRPCFYWIDCFCINQHASMTAEEFAAYLERDGLPVAIWVSNTRPPRQTNTCFRRVCSPKVECSCFAR